MSIKTTFAASAIGISALVGLNGCGTPKAVTPQQAAQIESPSVDTREMVIMYGGMPKGREVNEYEVPVNMCFAFDKMGNMTKAEVITSPKPDPRFVENARINDRYYNAPYPMRPASWAYVQPLDINDKQTVANYTASVRQHVQNLLYTVEKTPGYNNTSVFLGNIDTYEVKSVADTNGQAIGVTVVEFTEKPALVANANVGDVLRAYLKTLDRALIYCGALYNNGAGVPVQGAPANDSFEQTINRFLQGNVNVK